MSLFLSLYGFVNYFFAFNPSIQIKYSFYFTMCILSLRMCITCILALCRSQKMVMNSPGTGVTEGYKLPCVLGVTGSALTHWAISSAPALLTSGYFCLFVSLMFFYLN